MTLLLMEGFGSWATGTMSPGTGKDYLGNWSALAGNVTVTSLFSGGQGTSNYIGGSGNFGLQSKALGGLTTIYIGFRFKYSGSSGRIVDFRDGGSTLGALAVNGGLIQYTIASIGGVSGDIKSSKSIPAGSWSYIEAKIVFDNSSGSVDFWLNGQAAGSYTSQDTIYQGTSCTSIIFARSDILWNWGSGNQVADVYIDTTTQHGPMDIWYQAADTAGSASNFTPLSGSNQSNVDEVAGNDGDTTYNSSTTTTTKDQIAHSDSLNVAPLALQPMAFARYIPTGSANLKVGVLSGATEDLDAAVGLLETYSGIYGKIYETDPNTASAWTIANADAAETVYEHN